MAGEKEFDVVGELSHDMKSIKLTHHAMLKRSMSGLAGEKLRVRFSKLRRKRSDAQNRYLWGVVVPIVRKWLQETQGESYTKDDVYVWLRVSLLGQKPKVKEIAGEEVIVMEGKRFSEMTTKEFAEAVDRILEDMAEYGLVIPEPRQHNFLSEFI